MLRHNYWQVETPVRSREECSIGMPAKAYGKPKALISTRCGSMLAISTQRVTPGCLGGTDRSHEPSSCAGSTPSLELWKIRTARDSRESQLAIERLQFPSGSCLVLVKSVQLRGVCLGIIGLENELKGPRLYRHKACSHPKPPSLGFRARPKPILGEPRFTHQDIFPITINDLLSTRKFGHLMLIRRQVRT